MNLAIVTKHVVDMRSDPRNDVGESNFGGNSIMTAGLTCRKSTRTTCSQRELELTDSSSVSGVFLSSKNNTIVVWRFLSKNHRFLRFWPWCVCVCVQISDDTCTGSDGQGRNGSGPTRSGNRRKRKSSGKDKNVRRLESNERERLRMHSINDAFQVPL